MPWEMVGLKAESWELGYNKLVEAVLQDMGTWGLSF